MIHRFVWGCELFFSFRFGVNTFETTSPTHEFHTKGATFGNPDGSSTLEALQLQHKLVSADFISMRLLWEVKEFREYNRNYVCYGFYFFLIENSKQHLRLSVG